jgi:signal transduction histidine kinase
MRRAIARGTGLTHHLLAFSRRRPVNPESIDLEAHLRGMRDVLLGALRGDIEVEMKFGADLWPVHIDAGEFELAMLNLCVNARDAMATGGTITISAENVTEVASDGVHSDLVKLCVADSGCGMSQEVLARVFEPFFTTKDVGKGSGLGLPQVYGFVQQSGGRLALDSEVGAGTLVTLMLPRSSHQPVVPVDATGRLPLAATTATSPSAARRG